MAVKLFDFLDVLVTFFEQKLVLGVKGFLIGFRKLQNGLNLTIKKRAFLFSKEFFKAVY